MLPQQTAVTFKTRKKRKKTKQTLSLSSLTLSNQTKTCKKSISASSAFWQPFFVPLYSHSFLFFHEYFTILYLFINLYISVFVYIYYFQQLVIQFLYSCSFLENQYLGSSVLGFFWVL